MYADVCRKKNRQNTSSTISTDTEKTAIKYLKKTPDFNSV